jgi:predicted ATPase
VDLFTDLARTVPGDRLRMEGLDETTVAELLAVSSVGGAAAMAAEVCRRTGGNPFFITELVASGLDASNADAVPWRVQELIQSRLSRVGDACRAVLTVAAVAGRSFDPMLVAECAGVDADAAIDLLDLLFDRDC